MPVTPPAMVISCPSCHWRVHWQAKSDVLMSEQDLPPVKCPVCGEENLIVKPLSLIQALLRKLVV